jgi:3D (Asp-Asp-Asp) domain-containing protein
MEKKSIKSYIPIISVIVAVAVLFAIPAAAVAESDVAASAPVVKSMQTTHKNTSATKTSNYTAKAKADGKSHIKITWTKVKDADGYTVYRSSKPDKRGKEVYSTAKASKKSCKDKSASIDKTYWYTVRAWKKVDGKKLVIATIKSGKVKNSLKYKDSFTVKTYAYSGGGTTASGKKAQVGRVAVDPRVIELGTWLYVEDYGLCQAADTGGAIKGNKVDLYMNSESECYAWGVRHKDVYILE